MEGSQHRAGPGLKILAIDTATAPSSVALGDGDQLLAMSLRVDRVGHLSFLAPAIDMLFDQVGWSARDLDAVAVNVGPGPYTGLRIGVATAQAVAASIGIPIIPVGSLTALAWRAATGRRRIWPVIDMRRRQVATQAFMPVPGGVVADGPAQVVSAEEFHTLLSSDDAETLVVGDVGAIGDGFLDRIQRAKQGRPRYPSADVVFEIANLQAKSGEFSTVDDIRPRYMREVDADISWKEFRVEGVWPGSEPS